MIGPLRVRAVVVAVLTSVVLGFAWAGPAQADRSASLPSGTLVVGDSITSQSAATLLRVRPRWRVDGVGGRKVGRLPGVLARHLERRPTPRRVVIALGSNGEHDWTKADYEEALALLPPTTEVLFVTLWRNPRWYPETAPFGKRPTTMETYSSWMREIAAERPHTCVFDWRRKVSRRPWLLRDGAHPTARGKRVWARGISRQAAHCAQPTMPVPDPAPAPVTVPPAAI